MCLGAKFHKVVSYLKKCNVLKSIYWALRLHIRRFTQLCICPNSIICIDRDATLDVRKGALIVNDSWFEGRARRYKSELRIIGGGKMTVEGDFKLMQGASIFVDRNATLILHGGNSFLNTNSTLNCFHHIEIGKGCAISDNVSIADSDSHIINGNKENVKAPIIIEDHVWIAKNVIVLKGVRIGEGAIIGAGAVVSKDIPPHCLAVGNPAHVIKENVEWA